MALLAVHIKEKKHTGKAFHLLDSCPLSFWFFGACYLFYTRDGHSQDYLILAVCILAFGDTTTSSFSLTHKPPIIFLLHLALSLSLSVLFLPRRTSTVASGGDEARHCAFDSSFRVSISTITLMCIRVYISLPKVSLKATVPAAGTNSSASPTATSYYPSPAWG